MYSRELDKKINIILQYNNITITSHCCFINDKKWQGQGSDWTKFAHIDRENLSRYTSNGDLRSHSLYTLFFIPVQKILDET